MLPTSSNSVETGRFLSGTKADVKEGLAINQAMEGRQGLIEI